MGDRLKSDVCHIWNWQGILKVHGDLVQIDKKKTSNLIGKCTRNKRDTFTYDNRYMERHNLRENPQTKMLHHLTHTHQIGKNEKWDNILSWRGCGKMHTVMPCWEKVRLNSRAGEQAYKGLMNLNVHMPNASAIPFLVISPREILMPFTSAHWSTRMNMLITVLVVNLGYWWT